MTKFTWHNLAAIPKTTKGGCQSCNVRDVEVKLRFEPGDEDEFGDVFWLCKDCASLADGAKNEIKEALIRLSNWA